MIRKEKVNPLLESCKTKTKKALTLLKCKGFRSDKYQLKITYQLQRLPTLQ